MTANSGFFLFLVVYGAGMFLWGARWKNAKINAHIRDARRREQERRAGIRPDQP